jgi:DNA-binding transcriptional MocR family regulator
MDLHAEIRMTRVESLVQRIADAIANGKLPPGARLPSIRRQAQASSVSAFTVVEAYERLVAQGFIQSQPGSGFFVLARDARNTQAPAILADLPVDEHWLLRNVYNQPEQHLPAGCGWLPGDWFDVEARHRVLRALAREGSLGAEYGNPLGYPALRAWLAQRLAQCDIPLLSEEILLTQGASSALNIAAATVARPGDTLLVDDPGYCNLLSTLTFNGYHLVGVPWNQHGPDTVALESLLKRYRPRAYFTNPWLQNPTGASYSPATAHQVLSLAERHDFLVVEDNVSADLGSTRQPTLAALDNLQRVIYIGSFSKSLSPGLRVGYIAARAARIEKMVRYKMMSGLTTPEINERIVLQLLQGGSYRKQLERLRNRLAEAQFLCARRFEQIGWELFTRPQDGLFLLAKPSAPQDSFQLAKRALREKIILAPGKLFRPYGADSPWLRFNVAYCHDETLWRFLRQHA